jgi:hypothetical protein
MRCPHCVEWTGPALAACPSCGFHLGLIDQVFGSEPVFLDRMTDATRCLGLKERGIVDRELDRFEASFPQLFAAVYIGYLPATTNVREFGFWLLNRAALPAVDFTKPNHHGLLLVIDQSSRTASLTAGYFVEPFLEDRDLLEALRAGHPMLVAGDPARGAVRCLRRVVRVLRARSRQAARHPARFAARFHSAGATGGIGLEPIRTGHHPPAPDWAAATAPLARTHEN